MYYKKLLLFLIAMPSIGVNAQTICECLNHGHPERHETIQVQGAIGSTDGRNYHFDLLGMADDMEVGKEYKIITSLDGNGLESATISIQGTAEDLLNPPSFTYNSFQVMTISGVVRASRSRTDIDHYQLELKKKSLGFWVSKDVFDLYIYYVCPWEDACEALYNGSNTTYKYEANSRIDVGGTYGTLTVSGSGVINFDAGGSIVFNPGASTTVGNGAIEAYIDGCGGSRSVETNDNSRPDIDSGIEPVISAVGDASTLNIDYQNLSEVKLFPNPTNQIATLLFDNSIERDIKVYNSLGLVVFEKKASESSVVIDLKNQLQGVYYVRINDALNHNKTIKLIKL